jgi:hypothetical protein
MCFAQRVLLGMGIVILVYAGGSTAYALSRGAPWGTSGDEKYALKLDWTSSCSLSVFRLELWRK